MDAPHPLEVVEDRANALKQLLAAGDNPVYARLHGSTDHTDEKAKSKNGDGSEQWKSHFETLDACVKEDDGADHEGR
jgi:hypothetical protein